MKSISLLLFLLIFSIPRLTLAADEAKPASADVSKTSEKAVAARSETKIGSVDLALVAEKSEVGTKAMATLKGMFDKFQANSKKKEKELETLKNALQRKDLTPEKRSQKEKLFQKKFGDYQEFVKKSQQEFVQKQGELSKQIKDELEKVVKDYGSAHGYAVILNKEGLVYKDAKYEIKDLTDEFIKLVGGGAVKK